MSPGAILRKYLLDGQGTTQEVLAKAMGVSRFSINQIINGRRSVTAEMALKLGQVTSTTPDFWLNLQRDVDLYEARQALGDKLSTLPIIRQAKTESELFHDVTNRPRRLKSAGGGAAK